jgi:hypothetical protein
LCASPGRVQFGYVHIRQEWATNEVASILLNLAMLDAKPAVAAGGWDFTPAIALAAVALIIGFAIVAAGWVVRRDV